MTLILLTPQTDLSVAAMLALMAMISAQLFVDLDIAEPIPMIAGLGASLVLGFLNHFAIKLSYTGGIGLEIHRSP